MRINWTKDMEEFLEDKWGIWSVKRLAKYFNCTEKAIVSKSEKLKLGGAYGQYLTVNQISDMFSVHRYTIIKKWIGERGLQAVSLPLRKQKVYRVLTGDLLLWLEANQDIWDSKRLDMYALGGDEPTWLTLKRISDVNTVYKQKEWSMSEYKRLIELSDAGVPLREIANILGRTYCSIRRKRQYYLDSKKEAA